MAKLRNLQFIKHAAQTPQTPVERLVGEAMAQASAFSLKHVPPTEELKELIYDFINNKINSEEKLRNDLENFYRVDPNHTFDIINRIKIGLRAIDR